MSNTGTVAANFHEGSRSEPLAEFVFRSFGTAFRVPHEEDVGFDLYCTTTELIGRLAWPRYNYTVQVKSDAAPWRFASRESVRWLVQHPLPLFLCVVDKAPARLRLYHTFPRFLLWAYGTLPDCLELVPDEGYLGRSVQWDNGTTFSLSAPILNRTVDELADPIVWAQAKQVIEFWLDAERENLDLIRMGMPGYVMPDTYETNTTVVKGKVWQWGGPTVGMHGVRETLGKTLPWLAHAYYREGDLRGMVRAALLQRYLHPDRRPGVPDPTFVQDALNEALGLSAKTLGPKFYVFAGVDSLSVMLDERLGLANSPA